MQWSNGVVVLCRGHVPYVLSGRDGLLHRDIYEDIDSPTRPSGCFIGRRCSFLCKREESRVEGNTSVPYSVLGFVYRQATHLNEDQ